VNIDVLFTYFVFVIYWRINRSIMEWYMLFIDFKKAYDSIRREVLHNTLNESWYAHETSSAN